ncbi:hypothetical protein B0H14DRAFT_2599073 [Mycena olivaceomarginata]|nr:hypothetical protein B0H14DRAFT_2599073 [Mycena olivaceomarginata]
MSPRKKRKQNITGLQNQQQTSSAPSVGGLKEVHRILFNLPKILRKITAHGKNFGDMFLSSFRQAESHKIWVLGLPRILPRSMPRSMPPADSTLPLPSLHQAINFSAVSSLPPPLLPPRFLTCNNITWSLPPRLLVPLRTMTSRPSLGFRKTKALAHSTTGPAASCPATPGVSQVKEQGMPLKRNSLDSGLHKTTTKPPLQQSIPPKIGFGTNTIRLLDFNKAVQQHASTTQLPTTIPLAPGMGRVIWVGYKVAGSLDRGHQGRVCRHYKHPASDPTHYDSASVNIGVKAKAQANTQPPSRRSNTLRQRFRQYRGEGKAASATASWVSKRTPYASVNIGVKAKLLAQLLAGSQREHPWILYVKAPRTNNSNLN